MLFGHHKRATAAKPDIESMIIEVTDRNFVKLGYTKDAIGKQFLQVAPVRAVFLFFRLEVG